MDAPIMINTIEKPIINKMMRGSNFKFSFRELFCKSLKDLPTMYEINPGTIGRTQGERKLKTPAKKAMVKGISWVIKLL